MASDDLLTEFPVRVAETVRFCDMDAYGHVNNAVYLRFFESARMEYLERIGFLLNLDDPGIGPILAETRCRYRLPLRHPDTVDIGARVTHADQRWMTMEYRVVSRTLGKVAADGDGRVVVFDYANGVKANLPDPQRERLDALEKTV
ncbi:MAG: acyl-CoA thioesterase [Gammaproteobacteria bacterium]